MNRLATRNRILAVALVTLIFLGYQSTLKFSPRFRAKATLLIGEPSATDSTNLSSSRSTYEEPDTDILTVVDSFVTTDLMKQVIFDHDLHNYPEFAGRMATDGSPDRLARYLASHTSVRLRDLTRLIEVSVTGGDPELVVNLANWIAQGYIKQKVERKRQHVQVAKDFFTERIERQRLNLRNAEVAFTEFRRSSGLVVTPDARQEQLMQQVATLERERAEIIQQETQLASDLEIIQQLADSPGELLHWPLPGLALFPDWQAHQERRREQQWVLDRLRVEHGDETPIVDLQKRVLARVDERMAEMLTLAPKVIGNQLNLLKLSKSRLEDDIDGIESQLLSMVGIAVEYRTLEQNVASQQARHRTLFDRLNSSDFEPPSRGPGVTLIEESTRASDVTPSQRAALIRMGFMGFAIGIVGVMVFETLRRSIFAVCPKS